MQIIKEIEIEGKKAVALFDNGSYHTYVIKRLLSGALKRKIPNPYKVGTGGETIEAWEITLDPKKGTLGLERLKRREFTEY